MGEWKEYKLGEVADVLNGYAFKSDEFSTYGVPVIKIKNVASGNLKMEDVQYYQSELTEKIKKFEIKKNDILIAMTGSHITQPSSVVGRSCRYNLDSTALLNQRVGKIFSSDKTRLDEDFLFYFLKQEDVVNGLALSAGGSANQANISSEQIRNTDIYLPPLSEQKTIASVLSSLDDKIDLLHRQNKTLEALAETLFRQWFVEEVEEEWAEKGLDEIAEFMNGLACQKYPPVSVMASLPVIKIKELRLGISEATDMARADVPEKYIINDGDILFSWSGSLEIVIWAHGKGVLNQHLFKVNSKKYTEWFFYFWIKYHLPEFRNIAQDKATTMGHIQRHHLSDAIVVIPDSDNMKHFDEKIKPMFHKIKSNLTQIRTLTRLRDTLLPKLMSGEVRIIN